MATTTNTKQPTLFVDSTSRNWTSEKTGKSGITYLLSLRMNGEVHQISVTPQVYDTLQQFDFGDPVVPILGFTKNPYGRSEPSLVSLRPATS